MRELSRFFYRDVKKELLGIRVTQMSRWISFYTTCSNSSPTVLLLSGIICSPKIRPLKLRATEKPCCRCPVHKLFTERRKIIAETWSSLVHRNFQRCVALLIVSTRCRYFLRQFEDFTGKIKKLLSLLFLVAGFYEQRAKHININLIRV